MFEIGLGDRGQVVLSGRFDASQADKARAVFDALTAPTEVDLSGLDYISSLGLSVLLKTQKRLRESCGGGLRLVHVNKHIMDIFRFSGFQHIFEIASDGD
jgi:anti-sigma B factor antagonist